MQSEPEVFVCVCGCVGGVVCVCLCVWLGLVVVGGKLRGEGSFHLSPPRAVLLFQGLCSLTRLGENAEFLILPFRSPHYVLRNFKFTSLHV